MKKKLIEVALPLEAINRESAREKSIRHGHPSTLHLWWARRPLAACRAVIFAQLVDDPSSHPEQFPTEEAQEQERQRLFRILEDLVKWENSNNERVLKAARAEILKLTDGNPPPVLDPFCGGGSIPLEAQRLGLEAHASDLNPVAVLITKALIEIPPKFTDHPPVHPSQNTDLVKQDWRGARGLAEDVRYYGQWMRDEAQKRIGQFYPKVKLPEEYDGGEATVIAWLWARTVVCPNPACKTRFPLVRSFCVSKRRGKEVWVIPKIDPRERTIGFILREGSGEEPTATVGKRGASCLVCESLVPLNHIRAEGQADRLSAQLMACVAEGDRCRIYVSANAAQVAAADCQEPENVPQTELPQKALGFRIQSYGLNQHRKLFTFRQLITLTTFSDLISELHSQIRDDNPQANTEYVDAITTYLALSVSRVSQYWSCLASWHNTGEKLQPVFGRAAMPMVWDYAEGNPFCNSTGNFLGSVEWVARVLDRLLTYGEGHAVQADARGTSDLVNAPIVSTDPPYYDNIGYADLSDFFYVWLRRSLAKIFPELFSTLLTPKESELIASSSRHGDSAQVAKGFFEEGLTKAISNLRDACNPKFPLTIFYAFKQAENEAGDLTSTGWETILSSLIDSGFTITGTWPVRTEMKGRLRDRGLSNALASSIVLVCRRRDDDAPQSTRREFLTELKRKLPGAIRDLQHGNIAPVDLAQASIGPGMAIFSRYTAVLEADGTPMHVRMALGLINQVLDEILAEQEGEFDPDTRWALAWFEQFGMDEALFGEAETLSKAKNTSVQGLVEAGILEARSGRVRLLKREELDTNWDSTSDQRLTVWEITQHLIRTLEHDGEMGAASLIGRIGSLSDAARDLAYRLYGICERKRWAQEALAFNSLVIAWPEITRLVGQSTLQVQEGLFTC